jgi:hypothetical protein
MSSKMSFSINNSFLAEWVSVIWLLTTIVHVGLAYAVFVDSGLTWRHLLRNIDTFLVNGGLWALATLLGGVFVAAIYWLVHYSTLRPARRADAQMQEPEPPQSPYNP